LMEKQSTSLLGLWSTLQEELEFLARDVMQALVPALKGLQTVIIKLAASVRSMLDPKYLKFFFQMLTVLAAIKIATIAWYLANKAVAASVIMIQALAGPAAWAKIAIGIGVATAAIAVMNSELEEVEGSSKGAIESLEGVAKAVDSIPDKKMVAVTVGGAWKQDIGNMIQGFFDWNEKTKLPLWDVRKGFGILFGLISDGASTSVPPVKNLAKSLKDVAKTKSELDLLVESIKDIGKAIESIMKRTSGEGMGGKFSAMWKNVAGKVGPQLRDLMEAELEAGKARPGYENYGQDMITAMRDQLRSAIKNQGGEKMLVMMDVFGGPNEADKFLSTLRDKLRTPKQELEEYSKKLKGLVDMGELSMNEARNAFRKAVEDTPAAKMWKEVQDRLHGVSNEMSAFESVVARQVNTFKATRTATKETVEAFTKLVTKAEGLERAKVLTEGLMTPVERARKEFEKIQQLMPYMKPEMSKRALNKLADELRPKLVMTGQVGFVDYAKQIQNALLRKDDPAEKTAKNTEESKKLLALINTGISNLNAKPNVGVFAP